MFRLFWGDILRVMTQRGFEVIVVGPPGDEEVIEYLATMGIRYSAVTVDRTGMNPVCDLLYFRDLSRQICQHRPHAILAIAHKPIIYSALAAKVSRQTKIVALMCGLGYVFTDSDKRRWRQIIARGILKILYSAARSHIRGLLFQNPDDEQDILRARLLNPNVGRRRMRGAGVNLSRFPATPRSPGEKVRFLMIARLLIDKGVREYAYAAREMLKQHFPVEFHLVGSCDRNPSGIGIEEVNDWVASGAVVYHGEQKDVRSFLRECDAFVLPSYREGTPQTSLEAMATGRPIVTCDVPGCRETVFRVGPIIEGGIRICANGVVCPPRSVQGLTAALIWVVNNRDRLSAMGDASRRMAEELYNSEDVANQVVDFLVDG